MQFLRATAGTAIARLSHLSVRHTGGSGINKSSPSAAPKTLVSGSVTLFQKKSIGVTPIEGPK